MALCEQGFNHIYQSIFTMISKRAHKMGWKDKFVYGFLDLVLMLVLLAISASAMN
jgi:hypothetical protein